VSSRRPPLQWGVVLTRSDSMLRCAVPADGVKCCRIALLKVIHPRATGARSCLFRYDQGRNEVRWRPGQEPSLAPPCSNLRSFGSKYTLLKKVLATLTGLFGAPHSDSAPRSYSASGEFRSLFPLVTPLLRHLGHFPRNSIKTRRNSIH